MSMATIKFGTVLTALDSRNFEAWALSKPGTF